MKEFIVLYLPWFLSFMSIVVQYLAGSKSLSAWVISIPLQLFWIVWIIVSGTYGFIPLNVCMTIISIRNLLKWYKESKNTPMSWKVDGE